MNTNKAQVFIIDDSPINISFLGGALEHDYDIRASTDAEEALTFLELNQPDLILLDIMMPIIDGYQFIKKIKFHEKTRSIPVIFVTSQNDEASEIEGFRLGAVDYITKPVSPAVIKMRVKHHLLLKKQYEKIKQQKKLFESVFKAISDGVIVCNDKGIITEINNQFIMLWPQISRHLIGHLMYDVFKTHIFPFINHEEVGACDLFKYFQHGNERTEVSGIISLAENKYYRYFSGVLDSNECCKGEVFCFHDISEEIVFQKNLEKISITDELTGLYNRRYFNNMITREVFNSERYGTVLGVLMADIDFFKQVNDTHGHAVGDKVLTAVAQVIGSQVRNVDFCCRYGGEEFVFLLPNSSEEGMIDISQRILRQVAALDIGGIKVTISLGGASTESIVKNNKVLIDNLIDSADEALYKSKADGRNRMYLCGLDQVFLGGE